MDYKTLIGLTSAIVGAGIVVAQDPSFEYPPVQPIINSNKDKNSFGQQKHITVRFKQASVEEVLDWLGNQGIDFVTTGAPKGVKIDLNVTDIPLDDVIEAVGDALGGAFVQRGHTYIFEKGARGLRIDCVNGSEMPVVKYMNLKGSSDGINFTPYMADGEGFVYLQDPKSEKEMKELREKMMKEFGPNSDFMKQMQKEFGDPKKWDGFQKKMMDQFGPNSQFHKDLMKQYGEGSPFQKNMKMFGEDMEKQFGDGSPFQKDMEKWGEEYSKKWENFGKQMEKRFGPGSDFEKKMRVWGQQDSKKWEDFGRQMEKQFGPGSAFEKNMKGFRWENGKMHEMSPKEQEKLMKDLEKQMKAFDMKVMVPPILKMPDMPHMDMKGFQMPDMPKMPNMPHMPKSFGQADIMDIAKTLSPAQREKNKRQGFLYWSDLTREQQSKLGIGDWSGNWSVSYNKDGESFTIKSDQRR